MVGFAFPQTVHRRSAPVVMAGARPCAFQRRRLVVDWMEKVTDEQYQAGSKAE
jgi:hypothetical protein